MAWVVIELSATVLQSLISTEFATKYLGWKREVRVKNYIGFFIAFILQVSATLILNKITMFEGIGGLIYPAIIVIYGVIYLNGSIFEKIIIACIDNGLKMLTSVAVLTIISSITPFEVTHLIIRQGTERLLVILMGISSYFFTTRMVLRLQRKNKFALSIMEWVAILGVFITSFLAGVLVFEILITSSKSTKNDIIAVTIMGTLILINVLCYYIFVNMSAKNKEKLKYSLMELRLTEQEKSLLAMKQTHNEIRKIRHDMKNYIECAATLLHNGKSLEAKNYLASLLNDKMDFGNQIVSTNSDAVNAVISSKISLCQKQDIPIHYEITGAVEAISEIDISILLGNLLDNAIEACTKIKNNANIALSIHNERNYLVIVISNTIKESVLKNNPNLRTTKKDKLHHGVGSISVKDIVSKHNGMINFYEKEQRFVADIWLKLD
jgi:sensor histidine kinase YesM